MVLTGDAWAPRRPDTARASGYALARDLGMPSALPMPSALEQTFDTGSGMREDRLVWDYTQEYPPNGRQADGFLVYWQTGEASAPSQNVVKLGAEARSWSLFVPAARTVSYGVAAYRLTHRGEEVGALQQLGAWRGVGGTGVAGCMKVLTEDVVCTGAWVEALTLIPEDIELFAVFGEVIEEVTGATSWSLGHASQAGLFAREQGVAVGTRSRLKSGVWRNPAVQQVPQPLRVTFNGGAATGGLIRLEVYYLDFA